MKWRLINSYSNKIKAKNEVNKLKESGVQYVKIKKLKTKKGCKPIYGIFTNQKTYIIWY